MVKSIKRKARALWSYFRLSPEKRDLVDEVISSGFGMHREPFKFFEDGLCTTHNADFLDDPLFSKAYAAGEATGSWNDWKLRWRAYVVCWCGDWAAGLDGDFVECGVNKGGNARMLLEFLGPKLTSREFYLLDTFKGFEKEFLSPQEISGAASKYNYPDCLQQVQATFAQFPSVRIVAGAVPTTLSEIRSEKIAFLSIDMNCVEPEIQAANQLWHKVVPGGVLVLDDYGFSQHFLQKLAFDEFARAKGVKVLSLPTGQGLIFKPIETR